MNAGRHPRSTCVMPGCRRWSTRFKGDWICGDHWREVPRDLKMLRAALRKRWTRRWVRAKAVYETADAAFNAARTEQPVVDDLATWSVRVDGGWAPGDLVRAASRAHAEWVTASQAWRRGEDAIWRRMKQAAIERVAGL